MPVDRFVGRSDARRLVSLVGQTETCFALRKYNAYYFEFCPPLAYFLTTPLWGYGMVDKKGGEGVIFKKGKTSN